MHSMTGFGCGQAKLGDKTVVVEMQSVNRKTFETNVNLPREWQGLERVVQEKARQRVHRGMLRIGVSIDSGINQGALSWDEEAVSASLKKLKDFAGREGLSWAPDADALIRLIAMHKGEGAGEIDADAEQVLGEALDQALNGLTEMRRSEGEALRRDLMQRTDQLQIWLREIAAHAEGSVGRYREMLLARLQQAGLELELEDERLLKELAYFADRCDISEEITRLVSHFDQFGKTLEAANGDQPVGRKLEFLLQEVNREFNTIGSKASNIEVSRIVIDAKNEIERIREQVQNVE